MAMKEKQWGHIYDGSARGVITGKDTVKKKDRDGKEVETETGLPLVSWNGAAPVVCLREELVDLNPPPPRVFDREKRERY